MPTTAYSQTFGRELDVEQLLRLLQPAKQTEVLSRLGKLWKQVKTTADAALKTEKVAQLGHRAWEAAAGLLQ